MQFVKAEYVIKDFVPKLEDYAKGYSIIQEPTPYWERTQRVFGIVGFGAGMETKQSFVQSCGGEDRKQMKVAKGLHLYQTYEEREESNVE